MKKIILSVLCLGFAHGYAQTISIPDLQFKGLLLLANATTNSNIAKDLDGNPATIDTNGDNEIQVSEALQISYLSSLGLGFNIQSFEGIEYFTNLVELESIQSQLFDIDLSMNVNLEKLDLRSNNLTSIDLSNNNNLYYVDLSYTQISSLDLSNLSQLRYLSIYDLPITAMDFSYHPQLQQVYCTGTLISELDFSNNPIFNSLICGSPSLTYVNIKNGFPNASQSIQVGNSPNYRYLCCDENEQSAFINNYAVLFPNCNIGTYCSFTPGGTYYSLTGNAIIDADSNGCDAGDLVYPHLKFDINSSSNNGSFYANTTGNYTIPLLEGNYMVTPRLENASYFNVSPASYNVQFPTAASPYEQDICITPNGIHYDLEIAFIRLKAQIPGTDVPYKIIFKNKGNQIQSGTITLNFDDAIMDFVSSNPAEASVTTNQLTWNYAALNPFETRVITFIMNLNSPMETPPLNLGDTIGFSGSIQPDNGAIVDDYPEDNEIAVNFNVVNSADPNDITCLEGDIVGSDVIGNYVHYMIRFENLGTANAMNVVVKNLIDANTFDITTLVPLYSNYEFVTKQKNNQFEFIFENIDLPFDDANNDGYLVYKIQLKNTLATGDTFTNQASIYFDFNFPIVTNLASSLIQTLNIPDVDTAGNVLLYPNPTHDLLNIRMDIQTDITVALYDVMGKQVSHYTNVTTMDLSHLSAGIYVLHLRTAKEGLKTFKIVKH